MYMSTLLAGALSGLLASFLTAPLDNLKIRCQLGYQSTAGLAHNSTHLSHESGTYTNIRRVISEEGIITLWQGSIHAAALQTSYGAVQFITYTRIATDVDDFSRKYLGRLIPASTVRLLAGAGAGAVATTITYPLDTLRTQSVVYGIRQSTTSTAYSTNIRNLFVGLKAALIRTVPYTAIFFVLYETLRKLLVMVKLPFALEDALAGMIASSTIKSITYPLDTMQRSLQAQALIQGDRPILPVTGTVDNIRGVNHAFSSRYYQGLVMSLLKSSVGSAVTTWTYGRALRLLEAR